VSLHWTRFPESTSNPADAGRKSEKAQHSDTPVLRSQGFEDSDSTELAEVLSGEGQALYCQPLKVGFASEARSAKARRRSRTDENKRLTRKGIVEANDV
jgi:hypothetical protein